jgi:hypothetical protein
MGGSESVNYSTTNAMKVKIFHLILLIGVALGSSLAYGQDSSPETRIKKPRTVADYKPRTLKEMATVDVKSDGFVPFRVKVTYTASARPISATSKDALRDWAGCCAGNPDHYKGYVREIRFVENGDEYWLAVEGELAADLQKESKSGDVVDLFLIRLSPPETSGKRRSALLIERFQRAGTNSAQIDESVDWIRANLPLYAQNDLTVEATGSCQIKITDSSKSAGVSKAVVSIPLADLDVSKVKVEPRSDTWELWLHAIAGKKSIRFMLYQGGPAEGGDAGDYSLIFREREKAEAMAAAFRRTINLCTAAKSPID